MLRRRAEPGRYQHRAELVAVQRGGVRLVVHPGPVDVRRRGVAEEPFLDGVSVEAGDRGQPAGDGAARPAAVLQGAGVALEVGAAHLEQPDVTLGALLVAAGLGPPAEHALISLLALNGLRVSEATGADIEHLGLERGHRTLTITLIRAARW